MKNLNQALLKFQGRDFDLTKNSRAQINSQAGYRYADLPHVLQVIKPELTACGLLLTQNTDISDGLTVLRTTVTHCESDESITSTLPIVIDEKPQHFGSRLTYWRRYAILTALGLSPDDDDAVEVQQHYQQAAPPRNQYNEPPRSQYNEPPQDLGTCPQCGGRLTASKNGGKPYCYPCWKASKERS